MLTKPQKAALHIAAKAAGVDDAQRRVIQRNVGGFYSAADRPASHEGFVAVMAFYEDRCGGSLPRYTPGYWRDRDAQQNPLERYLYAIRREAAALAMTADDVDRFLASKHVSGGVYQSVEAAPAYWLRRLLDALVAIRRRKGRATA